MTTEEALVDGDEKKQQFAGLMLLDRIITKAERIHASFMEKDDKLLEPYLNILESRDLLKMDEESYFVATDKGEKLYKTLLDQQSSYVTHFDIYSHVNLAEGTFAEKETDFLDDDSWTDLRVAVAEFKGIDPARMVFLAMLSDEAFFENPDWKFDLAMGSLFKELEEIVQTQIAEDELSYEDEKGLVAGHDVLEDVINQGSKINQERMETQKEQEKMEEQSSGEYIEETITTVEGGGYGYDPYMSLGAYAASAMYMEAMWHHPYW